MNTVSLDPALSSALWIAFKASAVLALAAMLQAGLHRRSSAAMRHLVWTLAIVGVLLLPVLSMALPEWPVVIRTAPPTTNPLRGMDPAEPSALAPPSASIVEGSTPTSAAVPAIDLGATSRPRTVASQAAIAGVYAAGVLALLVWLAMQRWRVQRLARQATDVVDQGWIQLLHECAGRMEIRRPVRLRRSRECCMPMALGTRRPAILIPAIADTWPEDRRRAVVLHELAHVARYDCLAQSLALAACVLYWFHPAAWWVARRLRIERELACDDRVIAAGAQARDYAAHLLEIAFSLGSERAPALAVTMARPRQLEGRMLAVLDAARNRRVPALRAYVAGAAIAGALVLPLASATSTVVAAAPDQDGRPTAVASTSVQEPDMVGPELKAVEWPVLKHARRLIYEVASAIGISQANLPGTWELRPTKTEGTVHLRLAEFNSSHGANIPLQQLEGLAAGQLTGAGGPVQFRLRRDAGTFNFEGVIRNGVGGGTFSFTPDANFPSELAKRGFARPTALEQYQLARNDTGYAFIDELSTQRYAKPQTSDLVRAGDHGVNVVYVRDMGALGYQLGTLAPLIELRDHGVTATYVRELANQGYKGLAADELRRARDHGVTPDYVQAMRDNGYASLTMEQLITARDHGIDREFVRGIGEAGYRNLPLELIIRARDHGVDPDYAREMRQLGYAVSIEALISARDHGVDGEYTRALVSLGYSGQPLDSLIRLRDHGIDPKYVSELKTLGYEGLSVDDLITLRDRGLTADQIRAANARAKTRLPVDLLKQLAR